MVASSPRLLLSSHRRFASAAESDAAPEAAAKATEASVDAAAAAAPPAEPAERVTGPPERHSFQTESRRILDIVARSLYTDKEVFLRELISNASDALQKLRFLQSSNQSVVDAERPLEIHISTDEEKRQLVIQDFGIGMSKSELVSNLGTIARSGSKAFIKELQEKKVADSGVAEEIIGQFGVGFYSLFMVADKVSVYSRSASAADERPHVWTSDGSGEFEVAEADNVARGTKIVLHLREDCKEFASKDHVEGIIQKYSNFVGFPIVLNGNKVNTIQALWTLEPDRISDEQHREFYRFISNAYDDPMYRLQFRSDAPINIKALFYLPEKHLEKYGMGRQPPGVSLYSRKVLIQAKCKDVLPEWLRFVKGVVDSEDIPLNISRESMQDSALLRRINNAMTRRLLRFLDEQSKADPAKFENFFNEFGPYLKEGACTDLNHKSDIAKLLRFHSTVTIKSKSRLTSLDEYVSRMPVDQPAIYYLIASDRDSALRSPYLEAFEKANREVLLCYQMIDDFVMTSVGEYNKKKILSIESAEAAAGLRGADKAESADETKRAADFIKWFQTVLSDRVASVSVTTRAISTPAIVVDHMSSAMQRMLKHVDALPETMVKHKLEINPKHPVMLRLDSLRGSNARAARLVAEQVYDNALIAANILLNPLPMVPRLNELLAEILPAPEPGAQAPPVTAADVKPAP
jgi:HSP90 family molecular chaperone